MSIPHRRFEQIITTARNILSDILGPYHQIYIVGRRPGANPARFVRKI
jgi:hypothetical protein